MTHQLTQHLRQAFEDAEVNARPLKLSGPLGQAFTEALSQEFVKKEPEGEGTKEGEQVATESHQLEEQALQRVASLLLDNDVPVNQSALQIYGVSKNEITEDDVIQVTQDIAALPADRRDDYVVILKDSEQTGETETSVQPLAALEAFTKLFGVKTYPSLEAFAQARFG